MQQLGARTQGYLDQKRYLFMSKMEHWDIGGHVYEEVGVTKQDFSP